jgi:hypothetical protein
MMGSSPDKRKIAAMIIAKARPEEGPEEGEESDQESHDEGQMEACGDMIDAMKRGDASALASALKAFMDMR